MSSVFQKNTTCTSSDEVCVFGKLYAISPTTGDTLQIVFSQQGNDNDVKVSFLINGNSVSTQTASSGYIYTPVSYEGVTVNITSVNGFEGGAPVTFYLS